MAQRGNESESLSGLIKQYQEKIEELQNENIEKKNSYLALKGKFDQ